MNCGFFERIYDAHGTFFPGNEVRLAQKYFFSYHRTELTARRYGVLVPVCGLTSTLMSTRQIIPTQSQTH